MVRTATFAIAISAVAAMVSLPIKPAVAKDFYQCFKATDGNTYCSCGTFKNHKEASEWIRSVVKGKKLQVRGKPFQESKKRDECMD